MSTPADKLREAAKRHQEVNAHVAKHAEHVHKKRHERGQRLKKVQPEHAD